MMRAKLRAKLRVKQVDAHTGSDTLYFGAVYPADGYPADGTDENNTFAKWTPLAELRMCVNNPELLGQFEVGQEFYVDFTPVEAVK